ncbi:MAG: PAS domain-containing protein [Alphaproteobacteria bacterium]|nr:PAS domain-containing protein [Alphaproteobacteria bacterium]
MDIERRVADGSEVGDLHPLYVYWRRLAGEAGPAAAAPDRRAIDPSDLPPRLLPRVKIVLCEAGDWRYGLVGTAFRDLAGVELSGKRVAEIEGEIYAPALIELFEAVRVERRPLFCTMRYLGPNRGAEREVSRLVLPFATHDEVDAVMVGARWRTADPEATSFILARSVKIGPILAFDDDGAPDTEPGAAV